MSATQKAARKIGERAATDNAGSQPAAPKDSGGVGTAILAAVGEGFAKAIAVEKQASAPIAAIPFPGLPAARIWDLILGLPHAHGHPPNLVPPAPPVPLPSCGPIIPLPYVSGADSVKIEGGAAARCGDFGLSIWCGGYVPMIEIFTGSASVWIESARAARTGDITKHCIFSKLSSADCPLGPPIGAIGGGAGNVYIGGAPMPSLTGLALEGALKAAGKAASAGKNAARAALFRTAGTAADVADDILQRFLAHVKIGGDDAFKAGVIADLKKMAKTNAGLQRMDDLVKSGQRLEIKPARELTVGEHSTSAAAKAQAVADHAGSQKPWVYDPAGPLQHPKNGQAVRLTAEQGIPSGSTVYYEPGVALGPGNPSDVVLFHELTHSQHMADGKLNQLTKSDPGYVQTWKNLEEEATVAKENAYRQESGLPIRETYYPKNPQP